MRRPFWNTSELLDLNIEQENHKRGCKDSVVRTMLYAFRMVLLWSSTHRDVIMMVGQLTRRATSSNYTNGAHCREEQQ